MGELLNVSQISKILGVSRVTVHDAIRKGFLTVARREKSGPKLDADIAKREWGEREAYSRLQSHHRVGGNRGGRPPHAPGTKAAEGAREAPVLGGVDFRDSGSKISDEKKLIRARAAQATIKAFRDDLELKKRKGELVEVAEVRAKGAELGTILMGALSSLPDRLAHQFASMDDANAIHALMVGEIDAMLTTVRRMCGVEAGETEKEADA